MYTILSFLIPASKNLLKFNKKNTKDYIQKRHQSKIAVDLIPLFVIECLYCKHFTKPLDNKQKHKFKGSFKNEITPRLVVYMTKCRPPCYRLQIVENCFGQMSYKTYLRAAINTIYSLFVVTFTPCKGISTNK